MRAFPYGLVLLLAIPPGCSGTDENEPPDDDDDVIGDDDDDTTSSDDDDDDDDTDLPDPQHMDPCADGVCWETELAVQLCHTGSEDEDFSSGDYNVHRYRSSANAQAETRIRLTRTGGAWQPAIVVADLEGTILSDGEIGRVEPGLAVQVQETGQDGDTADVWITTDGNRDVYVFVTGWGAVDSGFIDFQPTDSTYTLEIQSVCDEMPLDCSQPIVNGHPVDEPACGWLEYFGREVVPALSGSRDERLDTAATVAWWSLKEGVLFLENPIVYSNCAFEEGSSYIGPL